jgi:hypothetical protein
LIGRYIDMTDVPDWDELPQRVFADQLELDFSTFVVSTGRRRARQFSSPG